MRELNSDDGAVAILVAILTTVLVGCAAFATDLGMAYSNKRELQKGADAAALRGAGLIISSIAYNDTCATVAAAYAANTNNLATNLHTAADAIAAANNGTSQRTGMTVTCSSDNKRVEVSYSNTGSIPSIFAGIWGVNSLNASTTATADLYVATSGVGLRPYAVCATDAASLVAAAASNQKWFGVTYPNATCGNYGGNWYTLNCPEDTNNGTLSTDTANGCLDSVGVIPQYDTSVSPAVPLPPATIDASIVSQCTDTMAGTVDTPQDCMSANPGNVAAQGVINAWDTLLAKPSITVPVFDPTWNTYATNQVAKCRQGNNGCYPVQSLAAVKVCGYLWGGNKSNSDTSTDVPGGVCYGAGAAVAAARAAKGHPQDELWLALTAPLQNTGDSGPGGVAIGGGQNVYATRLIK